MAHNMDYGGGMNSLCYGSFTPEFGSALSRVISHEADSMIQFIRKKSERLNVQAESEIMLT